MTTMSCDSIDNLEAQIREAVASERYGAAHELLVRYREQVESTYLALAPVDRGVELPERALAFCQWVQTMVRTSTAQRRAELAQLDTQSAYAAAVESPRSSWQFEA